MLKNIVVVGDLHLKEKEPYFSQTTDFLEWLFNTKDLNNEETGLILLGDLVTTIETRNETLALYVDYFLNRSKFAWIKILVGNHDENIKTNILELYSPLPNVELISKYEKQEVEGLNLLFLPYFHTGKNEISKEELYSNLPAEFYNIVFDFGFTHVEDETSHFSSHYCDLSKLKVNQYLNGHIHKETVTQGGRFLGSPILDSSAESGKTPIIARITIDTKDVEYIQVHKTLEYYSVTYPDPLPEINTKYALFTVKESIDRYETIKYYTKQAEDKGYTFYSNKIIKKKLRESIEGEEVSDDTTKRSDKEWFALFKEKSSLDDNVIRICEEIIL